MKEFSCRDIGIECDTKFHADNDDEILKQAEEHGREQHGIQTVTDEMKQKIRTKIHDVQAA